VLDVHVVAHGLVAAEVDLEGTASRLRRKLDDQPVVVGFGGFEWLAVEAHRRRAAVAEEVAPEQVQPRRIRRNPKHG
jgi:hypothetical protein